MSLATRCTSCETAFRVAQDQLNTSEGWVRCGQCNAVFNALDGLFDLGREAAPERDPQDQGHGAPEHQSGGGRMAAEVGGGGATRRVGEAAAAGAGGAGGAGTAFSASANVARTPWDDLVRLEPAREPGNSTTPGAFDDLLTDPIDAHLFRNRRAEGEKSPAVLMSERDRLEFSDARFDSDLFEDPAAGTGSESVDSVGSGVGALPLESASPQQPDFLRRAERRARWQGRPVRSALVGMAVLGGIAFVLQVAHHFRDSLAAEWPAARPALAAWCQVAGACALQAPKHLGEYAVESSTLTRAGGADAFVLSVILRSRSTVPLALPSIDLSLTDGNGRLVARRVLSPADFGSANVLAPGGEADLQTMLSTGALRVSGYNVEIFYP